MRLANSVHINRLMKTKPANGILVVFLTSKEFTFLSSFNLKLARHLKVAIKEYTLLFVKVMCLFRPITPDR